MSCYNTVTSIDSLISVNIISTCCHNIPHGRLYKKQAAAVNSEEAALFTVIVIVTGIAHCPVVGVKV
jgi:hypothetical protein